MTLPQYRRHECIIDGRRQHLTPARTELLAVLLTGSPDTFLRPNDLIEALWPDPDLQAETAWNVLKVYVANLRRLGIKIDSACGHHRGRGAGDFMGWRIPRHARAFEAEPMRLAA